MIMDLSNEMESMTRSEDIFQVFEICFFFCYSKTRQDKTNLIFIEEI